MLVLLTDILRCPATGDPLESIDPSELAELNRRIGGRGLRLRDGTALDRPLDGALVTPDAGHTYPIVDGIHRLLESSAIMSEDSSADPQSEVVDNGRSVREFYDEVGWTKSDDGEYADTILFEDLRDVSARYNADTRRRVNEFIDPQGTFLLDIASGAVPFEEYVTYSDGYDYRLCADFSLQALSEAKQRLGERGVFVQCDITRLPLRDDSVDGFVSLHTIYHVHADEQSQAFAELVRVLRPGRRGVVVYSWRFPAPLMMPFHPVGTAKRVVKAVVPAHVLSRLRARFRGYQPEIAERDGALYFHPYGYSWYRRNLRAPYGAGLASWRSVSMSFQQRFAHDRFGGERLLRIVYLLERRFPVVMGRLGQYPLFYFVK